MPPAARAVTVAHTVREAAVGRIAQPPLAGLETHVAALLQQPWQGRHRGDERSHLVPGGHYWGCCCHGPTLPPGGAGGSLYVMRCSCGYRPVMIDARLGEQSAVGT